MSVQDHEGGEGLSVEDRVLEVMGRAYDRLRPLLFGIAIQPATEASSQQHKTRVLREYVRAHLDDHDLLTRELDSKTQDAVDAWAAVVANGEVELALFDEEMMRTKNAMSRLLAGQTIHATSHSTPFVVACNVTLGDQTEGLMDVTGPFYDSDPTHGAIYLGDFHHSYVVPLFGQTSQYPAADIEIV